MLLLVSALGGEEDVAEAWSKWKSVVDWQLVDHASRRLLPLVYRNLRRNKIDEPLLSRLKEVYLREFCKQALLFDQVREVLARLAEEGIDCILLKGAPLCLLYYGGKGLRPMGDVDILVRWNDFRRVARTLLESGWSPHLENNGNLRSVIHGCHFWKGNSEFCIDVHWAALEPAEDPAIDDSLWEDTIAFEFAGTVQRTLSATNQLFHVLAHGFPGNEMPTLRWIPDALLILRSSEVNWDQFCREARKRFVSARCVLALTFLQSQFDAEIPASVIRSLEGDSESWFDRRYLTLTMRDFSRAGPVAMVEMMTLRSLRSARGHPLKAARTFLRMVRVSSSNSGKNVLRWGLSRSFARLSNVVSGAADSFDK